MILEEGKMYTKVQDFNEFPSGLDLLKKDLWQSFGRSAVVLEVTIKRVIRS